MEVIIGISIAAMVAVLVAISKTRKKEHPLTHEQQQDIVEQVAIIQPIIQDKHNK